MSLLDQSGDISGAIQWELLRTYAAPDFVKSASYEKKHGEPDKLPTTAYAGNNRTFPIHTKAATWLSAAFVTYNMRTKTASKELDAVKDNILQAAERWGILHDVTDMFDRKKSAEAIGVAYALVYEEDGQTKKAFPLRNAKEVLAASEVFTQHHTKLAFDVKCKMAQNILAKMTEYGAMVADADLLAKCAGYGFTSAQHIAEAWNSRAVLLRAFSPGMAKQAQAVAESVIESSVDARDTAARLKMASLMDSVDKQNNLVGFYASGELERPEDVMFGISYKKAAEISTNSVRLVTGDTFELSSLEKLSADDVTDWLGEDFTQSVREDLSDRLDIEKLAAVVPTLPRPDVITFKAMLAQAGERPAATVKKAYSILDGMDIEKLAASLG